MFAKLFGGARVAPAKTTHRFRLGMTQLEARENPDGGGWLPPVNEGYDPLVDPDPHAPPPPVNRPPMTQEEIDEFWTPPDWMLDYVALPGISPFFVGPPSPEQQALIDWGPYPPFVGPPAPIPASVPASVP